jgi:hypothetical protein
MPRREQDIVAAPAASWAFGPATQGGASGASPGPPMRNLFPPVAPVDVGERRDQVLERWARVLTRRQGAANLRP